MRLRSKLISQWLEKREFEEQEEVQLTLLQCLKQDQSTSENRCKRYNKNSQSNREEGHQLNKKRLERILQKK